MTTRKEINYLSIRNLSLAAVLLILSVAGYLVFSRDMEHIYLVAVLWILTVISLLWLGNRLIHDALDKRISWIKQTSKRFFVQLMFNVVFSLFCINLTYYLFKVQTTYSAPHREQLFVLNIYGLLFLIPVLAINFGIYFMMQWKKAHIQSDKLKEENLRTQLDSLRMHLDPHFLFNNLNVLSSLIVQNPQDAQVFLDKFADVYRYVLQYKKEEVVTLSTELEFIEAYVFLLKKRFNEQLQVDISVPAGLLHDNCIPPLALQMLLENSIKHNKISESEPLKIRVFTEKNNWLIVQNTFRPKEQEVPGLVKTGLENIRKRYRYLSDVEIEIIQIPELFIVKIPLLNLGEYESA